MINSGLSEEKLAEIMDMMAWDPRIDTDVDFLYHYYGETASKSVFREDEILFRLADASTFEDKMEGKAIEVYYDLAIEELLEEEVISREVANQLSDIKTPSHIWLNFFSGREGRGGMHEYEEYIMCFSKKKADTYMFQNYCKDSNGYCYEFSVIDLRELTYKGHRNGAKMKLEPILYGRAVVEYLKQQICAVCNNPIRCKNMTKYIEDVLHYTQYISKLKKFSDEEEVRLIVFMPRHHIYDCCDIIRSEEEGHKYIYLKAPKEILLGVTCAYFNNKEETQEMMKCLRDKGYPTAD